MKIFIAPEFKAHTLKELIHEADLPKTVLVNKFTEESAKQFAEDFQVAEQSSQPIVPIIIDSFGGQVYALLSMIDTIKKSTKPVATIATGKAMSCGSILLSCGDNDLRFMAPHATVMIHDVSTMSWGKIEEVKADTKEGARLNEMVFKMMAKNCGQHETYFLDLIHEKSHADWYLDPEECLKHKLVNHIRIPEMEITATYEVKFK